MKTTEQLIEEFLANGGVIEKVDASVYEKKHIIGNINKKTPQLLTLSEGEELYGEKQDRVKKEKEADFSGINVDLIPEHLRKFMTKKETK